MAELDIVAGMWWYMGIWKYSSSYTWIYIYIYILYIYIYIILIYIYMCIYNILICVYNIYIYSGNSLPTSFWGWTQVIQVTWLLIAKLVIDIQIDYPPVDFGGYSGYKLRQVVPLPYFTRMVSCELYNIRSFRLWGTTWPPRTMALPSDKSREWIYHKNYDTEIVNAADSSPST